MKKKILQNQATVFNDVSSEYDQLLLNNIGRFGKDITYYNEYKSKVIIRDLGQSYCPKNVLEFGCGTGNNLPFLKKHFNTATISGYDISEDSLNLASEKFSDIYFSSDLDDFKKESYDLILVSGVIHHIEPNERQLALNNLFKFCSPNGYIFIFEHNKLNPITRKLVKECPFDEGVILVRTREMKKIAEKAGFKHIKINYSLFFPASLKKFFFIEKWLKWLPLGGHFYTILRKKS